MKYVLDANVGLKWVVPEQDSDKALKLWDEFSQGIHELLAPDVFPVEIGHALTRAERRNLLKTGQSIFLLPDVLSTLPNLAENLSLLPRAAEISSAMRVSFYDCLYVALAEREGCQMVTADQKLIATLGARFPLFVDFSTLP